MEACREILTTIGIYDMAGQINFGLLDTGNKFQEGQDNALRRAMMQQHMEAQGYSLNKAKRDDEANNAIMSALQSAKPEDVPNIYMRHGRVKEANDIIKSQADAR